MKNRDYKNFTHGHYYHLFNRGNGKEAVFLDDEDRKFFLLRLRENLYPVVPPLKAAFKGTEGSLQGASLASESHTPYLRKTLPPKSFTLLSYCLMPNHLHLLIRQDTDLSVSKLVSKVFTSYCKYFNQKYDRVGHVFQDRIKAVLVEGDSQLVHLSSYIHANPHTGGLVVNLDDYIWSSYLDYIGKRNGTLCDKSVILSFFHDSAAYEKFVLDNLDAIYKRKEIEHLLLD